MDFPFIKAIKEFFQKRRHRRFLSLYDFPETGSILDISCGDGDFLSVIRSYFPKLDLYGIDISGECIERAKKQHDWGTFQVADAESVPHEPQSFDTVLSCMSLHHYKNPQQIFSEIARVLHSDGTLYLVDYFPQNRAAQLFYNFEGCPEPYHFERYYRIEEVTSFARNVGLTFSSSKKLSSLSGNRILVFGKTEIC